MAKMNINQQQTGKKNKCSSEEEIRRGVEGRLGLDERDYIMAIEISGKKNVMTGEP